MEEVVEGHNFLCIEHEDWMENGVQLTCMESGTEGTIAQDCVVDIDTLINVLKRMKEKMNHGSKIRSDAN